MEIKFETAVNCIYRTWTVTNIKFVKSEYNVEAESVQNDTVYATGHGHSLQTALDDLYKNAEKVTV